MQSNFRQGKIGRQRYCRKRRANLRLKLWQRRCEEDAERFCPHDQSYFGHLLANVVGKTWAALKRCVRNDIHIATQHLFERVFHAQII